MKDWWIKNTKNLISKPSFPNFLILGAQKAGTSSLHSYLNYHPQLKGVYPKELHFFDHPEKVEQGMEEYQRHFLRPFYDKRLYYESTPNYLYHPEVAPLIKEIQPEMKFIVIRRNPVDRAYSAWNMFRHNYETLKNEGKEIPDYYQVYVKEGKFGTFEQVVHEELKEIEEGKGQSNDNETYSLLRKGMYQKQIEAWQKYFPSEQFFVDDFEKLTTTPRDLLNEISAFLTVKPFDDISIDFSPRNQREYEFKISEELKQSLDKIFSEK